ncbi:secretory phospholipase A2 receptor-like [Lineus longissimus]|uniref:secretory phospholipase A2 receptor-like n=1 Tax=Lineus longissimus TaxID=88925 RepID=UPI002B4F3225
MTRLFGQTAVIVVAIIVTKSQPPARAKVVEETPQQWIEFKKAIKGLCARDSSKISGKVSAGSPMECGLLCLQELGCESFEFVDGTCHFIEVGLNRGGLVPKEGCRHYSMQTLTMKCPDPYVQRGRHCYYFSNIASSSYFRSWSAAGLECQDRGGTRLAIETEEEQEILIEIWKGLTALHIHDVNGFWTDGKKEANSDEWIWKSTNTSFTYQNWIPSGKDIEEQCCMLHILGNTNVVVNMELKWHDYQCGIRYYMGYVCEKKI